MHLPWHCIQGRSRFSHSFSTMYFLFNSNPVCTKTTEKLELITQKIRKKLINLLNMYKGVAKFKAKVSSLSIGFTVQLLKLYGYQINAAYLSLLTEALRISTAFANCGSVSEANPNLNALYFALPPWLYTLPITFRPLALAFSMIFANGRSSRNCSHNAIPPLGLVNSIASPSSELSRS